MIKCLVTSPVKENLGPIQENTQTYEQFDLSLAKAPMLNNIVGSVRFWGTQPTHMLYLNKLRTTHARAYTCRAHGLYRFSFLSSFFFKITLDGICYSNLIFRKKMRYVILSNVNIYNERPSIMNHV